MLSSNKQSTRPIRTAMDRRKTQRFPMMGIHPVACLSVTVVLCLLGVVCVFYLALDKQEQQQQQASSNTVKDVLTYSRSFHGDASAIDQLHKDFYSRYGGTHMASRLLDRGIVLYGSIDATALRLVQAAAQKRPFVMAFAGYSVSVGRGNYFQQSFPFVVERVLGDVMKQELGIDLVVRNAAIGGIPSFPYGWCLSHFLGTDADVVSWDYGMNEGRGAAVLESYIRQALQLPKRPMFLMLDTNRERSALLQEYSDLGLLVDAISVGRADTILDFDPTNVSTIMKDGVVPPGFQDWSSFGAPNGCPGRSKWHPKKMEHELIGWMISMHMARAIKVAHSILLQPHVDFQQQYGQDNHPDEQQQQWRLPLSFPPPLRSPPPNDDSVTQLMYGHPHDVPQQDDGDKKHKNFHYSIKEISCRTSFLPAVNHDLVLPSVIVSGLAPEQLSALTATAANATSSSTTKLDMMSDRSENLYKSGWVLDVSKMERETKRKVDKCGGLGYIDMKVALYGIPESGTLRLWLPSVGRTTRRKSTDDKDTNAKHYFDSLVLCEANESRDKEACQLEKDIQFVIGGEAVMASDAIALVEGAGEYLKRKTCVSLDIPPTAKVTRLDHVVKRSNDGGEDGLPLTKADKRRLVAGISTAAGDSINDLNSVMGLIVDISARRRVSRQKGACCISHVVWEHH